MELTHALLAVAAMGIPLLLAWVIVERGARRRERRSPPAGSGRC